MSDFLANGPSPVARGRTYLSGRVRAVGVAGCCMIVAGGIAWAVWPRASREPAPSAVVASNWGMGQTLPERPPRGTPAAVPAPAPAPRSVPADPAPSPVAAPKPHVMGFWEDASGVQQGAQQAATRATSTLRNPANGDDADVATPSPASTSDYSQRMQTTRFADGAPTPHRFHVQYTIKKGTIFSCTPSQPISSALPGPVRCTTDEPVWSMDGNTVLLPRGTEINGSIERGLNNGDERLFLVWTDALTPRPDLLPIPLDSPAADEMGQSGVPGDVNDHLWRRIKTSLLLSAIDIASSSATALAQRGNGNTYLNLGSAGSQANTLGQMAFGRDLNIPSTLYRGPGQPLSVYVNHYIDLHKFYVNKARY